MGDEEEYDYGPLRTYEITWKSGHIEQVQGHQVTTTGGETLFGREFSRPARFAIHGMFPPRHWRLVITALEDDVVCIRDVTAPEVVES